MAYDDQQNYAKFLKKKCLEAGCNDCNECNDCEGEDCTCCPAGLVAVYDSNLKHIACLSPNDAEEYNANNFTCLPGYIKLYKNGTPNVFLGCVSESEFAALYESVNPSA